MYMYSISLLESIQWSIIKLQQLQNKNSHTLKYKWSWVVIT